MSKHIIVCPSCGADPNDENHCCPKFCPKCGAKIFDFGYYEPIQKSNILEEIKRRKSLLNLNGQKITTKFKIKEKNNND